VRIIKWKNGAKGAVVTLASRARPHVPPASGEPIFLAAERLLSSHESQAAKKRNPFSFPSSQARGSALHAQAHAQNPIQASKRWKTTSWGSGRGRYKKPNALYMYSVGDPF